MSDFLASTPSVSRQWCPMCEIERDPLTEILEERYCHRHAPATKGVDDDAVLDESVLSGNSEAGGATARAICGLIHRKLAITEPLRADPEPAPSVYGGYE